MSKQKIQFIFLCNTNRDHGPIFTLTNLINKLHDNVFPIVYCEEAAPSSNAAKQIEKSRQSWNVAKNIIHDLKLDHLFLNKEGLSRKFFDDSIDKQLLEEVSSKFPDNKDIEIIALVKLLKDINSSYYKTSLYKAIKDSNIPYIPFGLNPDIEESFIEQTDLDFDQLIISNFINLRVSHIVSTIIKEAIPKLQKQNGVIIINSSITNFMPVIFETMKALKTINEPSEFNVKAFFCGSEYYPDNFDSLKENFIKALNIIKNNKTIDIDKLNFNIVKCVEDQLKFNAEVIDNSLVTTTKEFLTKDQLWTSTIIPRSSSLEKYFKDEIKPRSESLTKENRGELAL